jgi:Protein of unknown function (DUF1091)
MSVANDSENVSKINFTVTSLQVLKQFVIFFDWKGKLNSDKEQNLKLTASIDMCKIVNGTIGNFLVKYILTNVKDKTNFDFKCPVAANTWYVRNLEAMDDSFIPFWIIGKNITWEIKVAFKGKVGAMKSMTWFGDVKINGSVSIRN